MNFYFILIFSTNPRCDPLDLLYVCHVIPCSILFPEKYQERTVTAQKITFVDVDVVSSLWRVA